MAPANSPFKLSRPNKLVSPGPAAVCMTRRSAVDSY